MIDNVVYHFNPYDPSLCDRLDNLLHQYVVTVDLYEKERLHAAYQRRTESMYPGGCLNLISGR